MNNFHFYSILGVLLFSSFLIPVFAEKIVYTNSYPTWYSYDCTDADPSSWTKQTPPANVWKYFNYYDGTDCYGAVLTFDFSDLTGLENVTAITYYVDSKSIIPTNQTANPDFDLGCELVYFEDETLSDSLSFNPTTINTFDCTGGLGQVQEITIPFSSAQNTTLTNAIQAGEYSQSWMVWGDFNSTVRTNLDALNYDYAIGKYANEIEIIGDGFNCATIEFSNWCNFYNEPWEAIKKALGEDYIGQWFYVLIFLPFPFSVFLLTRNGAYAGFVCLPIMLIITTIDQVVFEISLSMILIASAFGLYELLRKRLHE